MTATQGATPERGDIAWVSFNPRTGHEQSGRRPAVVLTPSTYNGPSGLAAVCPVTNRSKGYPTEHELPPGLPVTGVILVDQVRCIDRRARDAEFICTLPEAETRAVLDALFTFLLPAAGG